jgi:hypothetical protein
MVHTCGTSPVCPVIWSLWFIWFNQIVETDRMNKTGWRTVDVLVRKWKRSAVCVRSELRPASRDVPRRIDTVRARGCSQTSSDAGG